MLCNWVVFTGGIEVEKKGNVVLLAVSLAVFSRTVAFIQNGRTEKGNHLDQKTKNGQLSTFQSLVFV